MQIVQAETPDNGQDTERISDWAGSLHMDQGPSFVRHPESGPMVTC